jgi:hypothetical protein
MNIDYIQLIIQAGALGLCYYLIKCHTRERDQWIEQLKIWNQVISNHINHNTKALDKLSDISKELLNWLIKQNGK